ncbi:MAG: topoisomerase IV [Clostridia bacterium]|nr:topoisomerase IV [Clostridia bacterium]
MARKKTDNKEPKRAEINAYIAGAGTTVEQPITETLEKNYMPYAMSVILSRAIPEIDGFKPSHRKLLYTMYNMGLLTGARIKSANIVGRTMQLNPHGDAAIYETMVRLSEGNQALLHPYVESKGNFGKAYSRDMAYAASRYTEAKLSTIAAEIFKDIDKDTVDFVDNYDATMQEPVLLPVSFPSVLVNANTGIAVGMASSICPFNLEEVCRTTIQFIKDKDADVADTLLAPDFPGGGQLIYNREEMDKIYATGRGSFKVRSVWVHDKAAHCIDVTEIPPTTTVEAIIEKIIEQIKLKKITEISDIRDETDLHGLKITMDLKRGTDPEKLMQKLFRITPLEDSFSCNFNILIAGSPRVMGVREIIEEWVAFRAECVRRRVFFDLQKAKNRYHLLKGLSKILLDIDKAIKIVRETTEEKEVVPNLMIGFGIDETQAEYVAEIKLRHLNREYILKRLADLEELEKQIADLEDILNSRRRVYSLIVKELEEVIKKYAQPRRTQMITVDASVAYNEKEEIPDYPVHLFFTRDGYFKKITPQSLRMSGEQKLKEEDEIIAELESSNAKELLFFTNRCQVYKTRVSEFDDTKASVLGDYVPAKLQMDEGETTVGMVVTGDYKGYLLFVFENGRVSKVALKSYETKNNRKKLISAYSAKFPLCKIVHMEEDGELLLCSTGGRRLLLHTGALQVKATKDNGGVAVMTQKKGHRVASVHVYTEGMLQKPNRYRTRTLPAAGSLPSAEEQGEQLSLV